MRLRKTIAILATCLISSHGFAGEVSVTPGEPRNPEDVQQLPTVNVVGTTPLASTGTELKKVPGNFQTAGSEDINRQENMTMTGFMFRNLESVNINEVQSNPYQPDISYRGFVASPLTGTPIGLSVYQDGVRVNESFGDTVNWDLIPRFAIDRIEMVPGSNPLFGLNTLGGALVVRTKNGFTNQGTRFQAEGGSFGRLSAELTHGGSYGNFDWFVGGNLFEEQGWRSFSRSAVRQGFMKVGWDNETTDVDLSYTYAENSLTGNGAAPTDLLAHNWSAVYVQPETTAPRVNFLNFKLKHSFMEDLEFTGNAYYRKLDLNIYAADATLEYDEEDKDYELAPTINRATTQTSGNGGTAQLAYLGKLAGFDNHAVAGFNYAFGNTQFSQFSQPGALNAWRGIDPTGVINQVTGLQTGNTYYGLYLTDTFSATPWMHLTASGRWNKADVNLNGWGTTPDGDISSLDGIHSFSRFNPAAGFTLQPLTALGIKSPVDDLTAYFNYSEGFRVPTPAELACANPAEPCALPTNYTSDPPLKPIVSHTYEVGLRGRLADRVKWNAAWYRIDVDNEILYTNAPGSTTQGFFQNVSKTRREGAELGLSGTWEQILWFANYSYINATYQADALLENAVGPVPVRSGDRLPSVPSQMVKAGFDYEILKDWHFGADLQYVANQQYLHAANDGNQYPQVPEYVVLNLNTRYRVHKNVELFAMARNITDTHYKTYGLANRNAFADPVGTPTTFFSPGAPIGGWAGFRIMF
jgi:iron complex outermembrane receptor protein